MQINATVFVQAINFGITYLFLRKVLFKPVVQRIKQKETAKNMLLDKLKDKEMLLGRLQNEKTEKLERFRQSAKRFYTIDTATKQEMPAVMSYKKDPERQATIIATTKELLVKKVPHAY